MSPAAALWVGAHMWAWLSPNSYHVLQCLAASVPVMAGYAQTKKAAATGQLAAGGSLLTAVLLYIDCANACMLLAHQSWLTVHRPREQQPLASLLQV